MKGIYDSVVTRFLVTLSLIFLWVGFMVSPENAINTLIKIKEEDK